MNAAKENATMGIPAARKTDPCTCPAHKMSMPAMATRSTRVRINGQPAAHQGDQRLCSAGGIDSFKGGAATVKICGCHAVRMQVDSTMHGGRFLVGSGNVLIGGPSIAGDFAKWKKICHEMEATRAPEAHTARTPPGTPDPHGSPIQKQSYQNCGLEATRMLIWGLTDKRPTERELIDRAANTMDYGGRPVTPRPHQIEYPPGAPPRPGDPIYDYDYQYGKDTHNKPGKTSREGREKMLDEYDVPGFDGSPSDRERADPGRSNRVVASVENIESQLAEGKPVIVSTTEEGGNHVVLAFAAEYDSSGKLVAIYINDTGVANGCATRVPIGQMKARLRGEPITIL